MADASINLGALASILDMAAEMARTLNAVIDAQNAAPREAAVTDIRERIAALRNKASPPSAISDECAAAEMFEAGRFVDDCSG